MISKLMVIRKIRMMMRGWRSNLKGRSINLLKFIKFFLHTLVYELYPWMLPHSIVQPSAAVLQCCSVLPPLGQELHPHRYLMGVGGQFSPASGLADVGVAGGQQEATGKRFSYLKY